MIPETRFLFLYIGLNLKFVKADLSQVDLSKIKLEPLLILASHIKNENYKVEMVPVLFTESFADRQAAQRYAEGNMDMYLNPKKYGKRFVKIYDYVDVGSEQRASYRTDPLVRDNMTKHLDPLITKHLQLRWHDPAMRNFSYRCLRIDPLDNSLSSIGRLAKYLADMFFKDQAEDLKHFHGRLRDDFLRNQVEQRIILALKAELAPSVAARPDSDEVRAVSEQELSASS